MSTRRSRARLALVCAAVLSSGIALSGCQDDAADTPVAGSDQTGTTGSQTPDDTADDPTTDAPPATVTANVSKGQQGVSVDTPVTVDVADGTLDSVVFTRGDANKPLKGTFNADKTSWTAADLLEPGSRYVVAARATDAAGNATTSTMPFRTQALTLDEQTYPSLTPLEHETVGVGMPVIIQFDVPVTNRAAIERHLHVTSEPATPGSWSWSSDQEVHWRPKHYWAAGTRVHVDVDINGVNAGNGIYGQMDRHLDFKVGHAVVMKANLVSDQMKVMVDGSLARTIPITGGKPGYETRSGTKLIIEKFVSKRMDAATVGVDPSDPEYYNIPEVEYAQRVTFSGEFLHAAPWSVGEQGSYNVSHGCIGMSTDNGAWLFSITHRGDPVEVTGTERGLEQGNGWTDWDESYAQFKEGSAL